MKVLVISTGDFKAPYGKLRRPYDISRYLSQYHDITFACFSPTETLEEKEEKIRLLDYSGYRKTPRFVRFFRKILKEYDLAYVHESSTAIKTFITRLVSGRLKIPIIVDIHASGFHEISIMGTPSLWRLWKAFLMEKIGMICADHVIVASTFLQDLVGKYFKVGKVTVIPNSVDLNEFRSFSEIEKEKIKRKLGFDDKLVVVFTCPRIYREELMALEFLFQAIPYVNRELSNVVFAIVGGGPIIPPSSKNVIYTGFVKDLCEILNAADIAIAPYPTLAVTGGARIKIFEYWACKLPLVATKEAMRGIPKACHLANYMKAEPFPKKFAESLVALVNSPGLMEEISQGGHRLVKDFYNWERQAKRLDAVFRDPIEIGHVNISLKVEASKKT